MGEPPSSYLVTVNSQNFNKTRLKRLHTFASQQIEQHNFAGVAWRIEHKGAVVDEGLQGYADHALRMPLRDDTIYRLYSMTKPVISVRCLQLLEQGKLNLHDPIARWLPEFATMSVRTDTGQLEPANRQITVEDLLLHRSGLSYDFLPNCAVASQYRDARLAEDGTRPLAELVSVLASLPLASHPGQRWYYSYGTDVLAYLIECICEQAIAESLQASLFNPLGMTETGFSVSDNQKHRVADMFGQRQLGQVEEGVVTDNKLQAMDVNESYPVASSNQFARGGIGLFSTLSDYQKFLVVLMHGNALDGEPLLSTPMLTMLWQNRLSAAQMPIKIGEKAFPGYGWGLTGRVMSDTASAGNVSVSGEGGWAGAASTHFWVDRANEVTGLVMAQYLGSAIALGPSLQNLAYSALCQTRPTASMS